MSEVECSFAIKGYCNIQGNGSRQCNEENCELQQIKAMLKELISKLDIDKRLCLAERKLGIGSD